MVENFNNNKETDNNKNYNKTFSKFLEPNKNDKSQNLFGTIAIIMSVILVIIGIIASINLFSEKSTKDILKPLNKKTVSKKTKKKIAKSIFNKRQNILILGVDSNGSNTDPFLNTRSDTILILSVNPKIKGVNIISIPRDSKVYLAHNKGIEKINAAHAIGGVKLVKDTNEETFGFKINN